MLQKWSRSGDLLPFLALLLFLLILYGYMQSASLTSDGLNLAARAEAPTYRSRDFWNPRHLFWPVYGYTLFHAAGRLGYQGRSLELLQWSNAFMEALCAALLYLLLRRTGAGRLLAWSLSLWLGVSYTFWFFGTEIKFYSLTLILLLLSWLLLARGREQDLVSPPPESGSPPKLRAGIHFWLAGVAAGAAILAGLVNTLFIPVALLALVVDRTGKLRRRLAQADAFLAAALLSWILPTILVGFEFFRLNYRQLFNWFGSVRASVGYDVSSPAKNLVLFISRLDEMTTGFLYWMSQHGFIRWLSVNYLRLVLVLFVVFICLRARALMRSQGFFFWGALAMLVLYAAGFALVDPYNDFRYILLVPLLILVAGVGGVLEREGQRWPAWAALALALVLLGINWTPFTKMSQLYDRKHHSDVRMNKIDAYRPYLRPRDSLIMLGVSPDARYVSYFLKVNVVEVLSEFQRRHVPQGVFRSLDTEITYRWDQGERVFLDSDIFNTPRPYPVWAPPGMDPEQISNFFRSHYRLVPVCRTENRDVLYRMEPLKVMRQG